MQIYHGATFNLAHTSADAAPPAAQPLRGPGRRLPGRRRHAPRQRPAGDLRVGPDHVAGCWPMQTWACRRTAEAGTLMAAGQSGPGRGARIMSADGPNGGRIGVIGGGLGGLAAACTLAARGYGRRCSKEPWLGGKAAVLEEDGFRFDMGPTILTMPRVLRRIFAEAGRDLERLPRPRPARPAVALLLRRRLGPRPRRRTSDAWRPTSTPSPRDVGGRGLPATSSTAPSGCTTSPTASSSGGRSRHRRHDRLQARTSRPRPCARRAEHAHGPTVAGTVRKHVPDAARRPDARPLHPVRRLVARRLAGGAVRHRPHADEEGVWYPLGGTRAVPEALAKLAARTRRRVPDRHRRPPHRHRRGGASPASRPTTASGSRSPPSSPTPTACGRTASCSAAPPAPAFERRRGYEPACSGVVLYLGLDRAYDHLLHHDFVFSRDPTRSSTAIYRKGEPAPDPTCYLVRPGPHRTRRRARRAARRSTSSSTRPTCGRTTTGRRMLPGVPPGDPRQAGDDRRAWRTSRSASCSSAR